MTDQTLQTPFVHLHVHTEFSLLDGLSKIDKLVARAKAQNMKALAITDHGTMHGVINFYRACKDNGIKPILGVESYLAKRDRHIHDVTEKQPYHLLLLAKNQIGYQNLLKLASEAQLTGFYGKPRVDKELLSRYHEGIVCTSGCLAAEIPRAFAEDREDEAFRLIGEYQDIFGRENFFLELQSHDIPELNRLNEWLIRYKGRADVPFLATNDVHYVLQSDHDAHDTLLCIQTGARKADQKRMRMTDPSYFLRSGEEMWKLFGEMAPEALLNTLQVAEMCDINLDDKEYHLPIFPVPEGYTADTYLRSLSQRGAHWRYGDRAESETIQQRLDYELGVIHTMGFDTYFLIVWDLCQYAHAKNIWWNVRGSGAGSVVAYTLGITSIDPLENGLIFERFLNPGRVTMPDIDMDFPDDQRAEMINYAVRKYGEEKVSAIITFGTLKARAAIKDVARALGYPLEQTNALTQLIPNIPSHPVTLAQCLSDEEGYSVEPLKAIYRSDETARQVMDTALTVEGVARGAGTHAAGIIISDKPLVNYVPLHRPTTDNTDDLPIKRITQFPMEICESIGLLKVDFLGLSTLAVMRRACELIERYRGKHYTLQNIPYRPNPNDPEETRMVEEAFELIGNGEVTGVFQLEGQGMRGMLVNMKPKTFEHIIAAISLYRPGPMQFIKDYVKRMHGEEPVTYLHPKLEPILAETYSVITYQEQIQRIGAELFGYSLGEADLMRRAVSKKKAKDLAKHREIFIEKGPEYGVPAEVASEIFDKVEYFAAYGFNKSHAADYAVITCQTAFLKRHYPEEYYTALLSVQRDNIDDVTLFTGDCRRLQIPILGPNVNASDLDFTIEMTSNGKRGIRFGLGAIKGVGDKAVEAVISERTANGPFTSLSDFTHRVDVQTLGSRALDAMTKVGVFDDFGERDRILAALPVLIQTSKKHHQDQKTGQTNLFGDVTVVSGREADTELLQSGKFQPTTRRERLAWEKELVGLYVSDHPLSPIMAAVQQLPNLTYSVDMKSDAEEMHDRPVTVVGMVNSLRTIITKKGDEMAVGSIEDMYGTFEAVLFPRTWARYKDDVVVDQVYIFRGRADTKRGDPQVIVENISSDFEASSSADEEYAPPDTYNGSNGHNGHNYNNGGSNGNGHSNGGSYSAIGSAAVEPAINISRSAAPARAPALAVASPPEPEPEFAPPEIESAPPAELPVEDEWTDEENPPPRVRVVTISFAPCLDGNQGAWARRMQRIHGELIQHPGVDVLVFRIPDAEAERPHLVQFKDRIDFDAIQPYLEAQLRQSERVDWVWQS